ncbi:MAG: alginate lyase family protein [Acidobacteriota bacterium]
MSSSISENRISNLPTKIRSIWYRLSEMSYQEISYRLYGKLTTQLDKWRTKWSGQEILDKDLIESLGIQWLKLQPEISLQNLRDYLQNTVGKRFYFDPAQQIEYRRIVKQHFPNWIERACTIADKICQHRFQLLGFDEIVLGTKIAFQRSPETGRDWPQKHWSEIVLQACEPIGDPKIIWELNRHQQLLYLGLAYCYTQDERYTKEYSEQIESWIEQNPYQIGINWASSLEIAFRTINWIWSLFFFINSPFLKNDSVLRIIKSLIQHIEAIYSNPSTYSSPNTHLLGEAYALYLTGILFGEHRLAARWRDFGINVLSAEMEKQLFKDGAYKEQSSYYHCYMVELYLLATILAQRNRHHKICNETLLIQACEYLQHICQPGGELTAFGDEDGGKALMLGAISYRNPNDLLATAALLFKHSNFKYCAGEFQEATLWLMGLHSLDNFDKLNAQPPQQTSISFNDSGHVALRSDWSAMATYLLFHCPTATHLAGHSHADCLSFELASGGRPRLIDCGTYGYHCDPEIRNYFRGTSAHNSVRIDGLDQSATGDTFKWRRRAVARLLTTNISSLADFVSGEHDGYLSLPDAVLHRRAILFAKPDYFIIFDEFTSNAQHSYESYFHFGAASIKKLKDNMFDISYQDGSGLLLISISDQEISTDIIPVNENPPSGWYASAYGKKAPCLSLKLHWRASASTMVLTVLFPYHVKLPTIESYPLNVTNSFCVRVNTAEYQDIAIFSLAGSEFNLILNMLDFSGKHLFLRTCDRVATGALAINANLIRYDKQSILNHSTLLPYFIWAKEG